MLTNFETDSVSTFPQIILTLACFPSMTATHELVVPRSMPITDPLMASDLQHIHISHQEVMSLCFTL